MKIWLWIYLTWIQTWLFCRVSLPAHVWSIKKEIKVEELIQFTYGKSGRRARQSASLGASTIVEQAYDFFFGSFWFLSLLDYPFSCSFVFHLVLIFLIVWTSVQVDLKRICRFCKQFKELKLRMCNHLQRWLRVIMPKGMDLNGSWT